MAYNKFMKKDGQILLDLTNDTVTADKLSIGITAHDRGGELIVGTMEDGGSIIEVDQLPTENIDTTVLYKVGESYHQYIESAFTDLVICFSGISISFLEFATQQGITYSFNTIPTKTTENIQVTDLDNGAWHWYFITDENDVFMYGDMNSTGTTDWYSYGSLDGGTFNGVISDASEATEEGYYAVGGSYWNNYIMPSGSVTITENSIVDVTDKKSVTVDVPEPSGTKTITENGTHDVTDYESAYVNVPQPSGNIEITTNGTHDVTNYVSAEVGVPTTYMVQSVADLPTDAPVGSIAYVLGGE